MPATTSRLLILLTALLGGCAGRQPVLTAEAIGHTAPDHIELAATPFIPQQRYQCGPAALATLLQHSGVDASADQLVPQIYLPERKGSLQVEMLAASRRYNRIPYVINPDIGSLLRALQAGQPVVVLQNLGLPRYPAWHYAVVIGYTRDDDQIILRSGRDKRKTLSTRLFLKTWQASGNWGLLLLRPGELPADAEPDRYLRAVAAMEGIADPDAVLAAYDSALQRWPDAGTAVFGRANTLYRMGRLDDAAQDYRLLLDRHPDHAAAMNNLASLYGDKGCYRLAQAMIDRAIRMESPDSALYATLMRTSEEIARNRVTGETGDCSLEN